MRSLQVALCQSLLLVVAGISQAQAQEPCPRPPYVSYLEDNPAVAAVSVDTFDQETLEYFCEYVDQLDTIGSISIAEPAGSQNCHEPDSCSVIFLSATETRRILAAKTAHSIWLDIHNMVNWKLGDFAASELPGLFDPELLFGQYPAAYFFSVVDYSPSDVHSYMESNGLIGPDILTTVHLVLDDVRTTNWEINFVHGIQGRDPTDTAYTLYDALTSRPSGAKVSRRGCNSMSRILVGMLRSVNIPAYEASGAESYYFGHSSAFLLPVDSVVPHGDDIYNVGLGATPTDQFLPTFDFYADIEHTAVCGSDVSCLSARHRALLSVTYPARYTSDRCCNPVDYGYESCEQYLTDGYAGSLTAGEIAAAAASIESLCNTECDDRADNDGDGLIDTADPACWSGYPSVPHPNARSEQTQCQDGVNNDLGQDPNPGLIDFDGGESIYGQCTGVACVPPEMWPACGCPPEVSDPDGNGVANLDPQCVGKPWRDREATYQRRSYPCGLGSELALLLPPLMWVTWRRRHSLH